MITRKEKLITAAMLIVLFLLARSAGGAVISYNATEFTIFAGGDVTVGSGSRITGMVGAGEDVTFATDVRVFDRGPYAGDVFADNSVSIGNFSYISGRLMGDDALKDTVPAVSIGDSVTIKGRVDAGGVTPASSADIQVGNYSETGSLYAKDDITTLTYARVKGNINANDVVLGDYSAIDGSVTYKKTYSAGTGVTVGGGTTKGVPTAPDSFTYTLRTAPTFTRTGTVDPDITSDGELAPGTYRDLIVRTGVTLTVSAGTYDFQNITLESGANISIRADTAAGDVIIQAFEDLFTNGSNVLGRVGQPGLVVNIGNLLTIGSSSTVAAHLLAFSDTIASVVTIGGNSTILGKVYSAGNVVIGDNVLVPEPDTLVLLGFGTVGMLAKRRRRGKKRA